jgi:hypothetical protein
VASTAATRLLTTCKEAGQPLPTFSDDDFIHYCVTEALVFKWRKEEAKARADQERKQKVREATQRLVKQNG